MTHIKILTTAFIVIILFACLLGCTYTQSYTPELGANQRSIADSINNKYHFDNINVNGKKSSGTYGNHNVLFIQFINGTNIPNDDTAQKTLAKQLGKLVIKAVKNPAQFDSYTVSFDTRQTSGAITTDKYHNYDFTVAEMKDK